MYHACYLKCPWDNMSKIWLMTYLNIFVVFLISRNCIIYGEQDMFRQYTLIVLIVTLFVFSLTKGVLLGPELHERVRKAPFSEGSS